MNKLISLNLKALVFPAALAVTASLLLNAYSPLRTAHWLLSVSFYIVLCAVLNIVYALNRSKADFTSLLLVGIIARLLLALTVIVIYLVSGSDDLFSFAIHFILHYILFTIFEILYLLRLIQLPKT